MREMLKNGVDVGEKKATCCHRTVHDCIFSLRGETVQINSFTFPYGSVLCGLDHDMIMFATVGEKSSQKLLCGQQEGRENVLKQQITWDQRRHLAAGDISHIILFCDGGGGTTFLSFDLST